MTEPIRLFLVDDHELMRTGLRLLLKTHPQYVVAGEAGNAAQAFEKLSRQPVEIIILDISMPEKSGLDCLPAMHRCFPDTKILILSMHEDPSYVRHAMEMGASGYVHKSSADIELFDAITELMQGRTYIGHKLAQSLLVQMLNQSEHVTNSADMPALSQREREVLQYMTQGYSMTEIGSMLHLSVKTVDTYKTRIMTKLQCSKKSELVQYALKSGILPKE